MMGLKMNASEGSNSRTQIPTKRNRRQARPSGRKGNAAGFSAANEDHEENLLEVPVQEETYGFTWKTSWKKMQPYGVRD